MPTPDPSRTSLAALAWLRLCCVVLAAALPAGAMAQADPLRPPGKAAPARVAAATVAPAAAAAKAPLPQLQSVQLDRSGRATALVDGRLVRPGDRIGDAEVIAIDLQGLQLRQPQGRVTLFLLPALTRPIATPSTVAQPRLAAAGER